MYAVKRWNDDKIRQAYELALLGATDEQMAKVFNVSKDTIAYWKRTKRKFRQALVEGKEVADSKVVHALYQRAIGYEWDETMEIVDKRTGHTLKRTIHKKLPPDVLACQKWLQNRQPDQWNGVQKIEETRTNINILKLDLSGLSVEELRLVEKMQLKALMENAGGN